MFLCKTLLRRSQLIHPTGFTELPHILELSTASTYQLMKHSQFSLQKRSLWPNTPVLHTQSLSPSRSLFQTAKKPLAMQREGFVFTGEWSWMEYTRISVTKWGLDPGVCYLAAWWCLQVLCYTPITLMRLAMQTGQNWLPHLYASHGSEGGGHTLLKDVLRTK